MESTTKNVLLEKSDYELLVDLIYKQLQHHPENANLLRLMAWAYIQQQDFYNAFVQLRALDKKSPVDGHELLELGNIALENK